MKILITGGAGFVGSHAAEYFAKEEHEVVCYDNLSREELLNSPVENAYNWEYLTGVKNVTLAAGDIRDSEKLNDAAKGADAIIHTAAQTAVTASLNDPRTDFEVNALGTFNVLEAARKNDVPALVYCSTNKVYGSNVNSFGVVEKEKRYEYARTDDMNGITEFLSTDMCEHTPYGCSKLAGDIYCQDYARIYGLRSGVLRMSCIYGRRQFGVEDQGWVAWFTIATVLGLPITIYGNGKQVRDVLYVDDLVRAFDLFLTSKRSGVYNVGGGQYNTMSLLELLTILEPLTGKRSQVRFADWRPTDQKVYISDITKARDDLGWTPVTEPPRGLMKLVKWVNANEQLLKEKNIQRQKLIQRLKPKQYQYKKGT